LAVASCDHDARHSCTPLTARLVGAEIVISGPYGLIGAMTAEPPALAWQVSSARWKLAASRVKPIKS
jgi:hypothetical protein